MKTRQMQYLRPDEILQEMRQKPVAYLPLGLLEWHGPHLPLGVDALNAETVCKLAADDSGGLVWPTQYFGTERERGPELLDALGFEPDAYIVGMDFPANSLPSPYASEESFAIIIREQFRMIARMGFKVIAAVSGHGATNQLETLKRLAAEFNAAGQVRVLVEMPFVTDDSGVMAVGHASRIETAVMLAITPETVRLDNLPALPEPLKNADFAIVDYLTFSGQPTPERTVHDIDDPRHATADDGHDHIRRAAINLARAVKAALQTFD
jgi:creatinine amidohydrolase